MNTNPKTGEYKMTQIKKAKRGDNMKVKQAIYEMLTEGTGSALCDSGGAYGRHWQRNQKKSIKDFEADSPVSFEKDCGYTISVFHYLNSVNMELDDICDKFNKINTEADNWDSDIHGVSSEGIEYLRELGAKHGDGWNTYNGETSLSQVLQGCYVDIDNEDYVLIQIHQGCDVRGGYTDARLFLLNDTAWLPSEQVYGTVTLENGDEVQVDNCYNGSSLTTESGQDVEGIVKADLYLMEY